MLQVIPIVKLTIKEIIQGRVFFLSILLGLFFSFLSLIASEISYGDKLKVYFDIGLGFLFFSSMMLSVFLGSTSFSKSNDTASLYIILPKLKYRSSFLIGKIVGYLFIIFLEYVFLSSIVLIVYSSAGGNIDLNLFICLFFILLSCFLIFLISLSFSQMTSHFLAFFLSIVVYLIGYGLPNTLQIAKVNNMGLLADFFYFFTFIFPNFFILDIKETYLYNSDFDPKFILQTIFNTFIYFIILIFLNLKIFKRRNF
ncbi:MAG: hypothetical protein CME68_07290 [Halobacteriovoraceae bacterium]|nr:hypothetical protein [Halobacteriovoraceae bacterium]